MALFRKKPVVVDAEQWFPGNGCRGVRDDWAVIVEGVSRLCGCRLVGGVNAGKPHVHPTRADHGVRIDPGDWIIAEQDGSGYYPCKPDVFAATYDPVTVSRWQRFGRWLRRCWQLLVYRGWP